MDRSTLEMLYKPAIEAFLIETGHTERMMEFFDRLYFGFVGDMNYLHDDWKYFSIKTYLEKTVTPHKIAVYESGMEILKKLDLFESMKEEIFENLIFHDLSKYSIGEHGGYAFYDFKTKTNYPLAGFDFQSAWLHHIHHNPHHPEHWIKPKRNGETEVLPMRDVYIIEMIADWMGAGKTYGSTLEEWLPKNIHTFNFHEKTKESLHYFLDELNIDISETA